MRKSPPALDDWNPLSFNAVQDVFTGAPFRWWVCGGVALELHVGRSWRSHDDLDIGILRAEADQVYSWLGDWDLWLAAHGKLRPWQGEPPQEKSGENNVWARDSPSSSWRFDVTLGSGDHGEWVSRRDETIRRGWPTTVLWTADALPYLAPEVQLLFKSKNPRPKDDVDAMQVIPMLDTQQHRFLTDHLDSDHSWRHLLIPG